VKFVPGGPKRYAHQTRGLKKLLETGGIGALLFDPGLGKTATTLDFCSILALKAPPVNGVQEARVLVVCPLAAVDTWVKQANTWISPQVNFWAEALGGSIIQRVEAIAARGGQPYPRTPGKKTAKRRRFREINGVKMEEPIRAEGWHRSIDQSARSAQRHVLRSDGPDGLGKEQPRLIIEVLNFDTFSSRQKIGSGTMADLVLDGVKRYNPDLVIIDESHKIKGATSHVSRLMDRVGQQAKRRILLTGTVMPAGPLDVFAQWRFLDPYAFGDPQLDGSVRRATLDSFKGRYAVLGGYMGHEVVGYRNLDELQRIMGQRAAVARKEDELDLPPVLPVIVPVKLSPAEEQAYRDMKKNLASQFGTQAPGAQSTANNRLTQMMRLRQITSGHLPDDMGVVREIGSSKVDTILSVANDTLISEKRIVVFCLFTHEFHMLKQRFEKAAGPNDLIMGIAGETETATRLQYRATFGTPVKEDSRRMILIAQIKTMSISVNELITAQHVLFGSLTQQRDDLIQAIDRLNRIGQEGEKVTAWFFEVPGTIDTVIHKSHDDRTDLENAVLTHILSEDEDAFDRDQERALNAGTAPLTEEGAHDSHAAPATVLEADVRFPGVTSMKPEEITEAVGDFNGEDEAPFSAPAPDPEAWPPASAVPAPSTAEQDIWPSAADDDDDIEDLTVLG
jgi:SNF2 family DNA or RNA helicase